MIHGYITEDGILKLTSSNPTEKWALRQWFNAYASRVTVDAAGLEVNGPPEAAECE